MTDINPALLSQINGNGAKPQTGSTAKELNDRFLTLLVTQLKNQDPLNPMENSEMTSQLAQINTVAGIEQLNESFTNIGAQIQAGQSLQLANLIGKDVLIPGNRTLLGSEGEATPIAVSVPSSMVNPEVVISDRLGTVLQRIPVTGNSSGLTRVIWDGQTTEGDRAIPGQYRVSVTGTSTSGSFVQGDVFQQVPVVGVIPSDSGQALLDFGGVVDPVTIDQVEQIL